MAKSFMLPADVDPEDIDFEDPEVRRLIETISNEQKYNTELTNTLERLYGWQRKAMSLTKDLHVVGLICGNQMGKTEAACALITMHLTGVYPDWYKGRRFKKAPLVIAAGQDSNFNKNNLQDRIFGTNNIRGKAQNKELGTGMIPRSSINIHSIVSQRGDGIDSVKIKHSSGDESNLIFKGYEGGAKAIQGIPADVVYIDEQPPQDFWEEALTRTTATDGSVICAFTPLHGLTDLVGTLSELPPVESGGEDKYGPKLRADKDWAMVRASLDDVTHISEDKKQSLYSKWAHHQRDARYFGIPVAGHGRIFPYQEGEITYDPREAHVQDSWDQLIGLDIGHGHGGDPTAAVLVAWDQENDVIYVREENMDDTPTSREISKVVFSVNPHVPVAWPNDASRRAANAPETIIEQLREYGMNALGKAFMNPKDAMGKKNNHIRPGIVEINERFHDGRLRIHGGCRDLLKQIENYQHKENGDIPVDGKIDLIDAFRYAVMSIIQGYGEPAFQNPWDQEDLWEDESPVHVRSGVKVKEARYG